MQSLRQHCFYVDEYIQPSRTNAHTHLHKQLLKYYIHMHLRQREEKRVNSKCLYVELFRQTVNSENTDSFNNNDLRGKNNPTKPHPPDK